MSGIAELMLDKGYSIQGSDLSVNDNTKRLKKKGIKFFLGHNKKNIKYVKTEKDWNEFINNFNKNISLNEKNKEDYMKYGNIYGKKYAVKTDYGEWDKNFTLEILEKFLIESLIRSIIFSCIDYFL